jgi:hypothetical protein
VVREERDRGEREGSRQPKRRRRLAPGHARDIGLEHGPLVGPARLDLVFVFVFFLFFLIPKCIFKKLENFLKIHQSYL